MNRHYVALRDMAARMLHEAESRFFNILSNSLVFKMSQMAADVDSDQWSDSDGEDESEDEGEGPDGTGHGCYEEVESTGSPQIGRKVKGKEVRPSTRATYLVFFSQFLFLPFRPTLAP